MWNVLFYEVHVGRSCIVGKKGPVNRSRAAGNERKLESAKALGPLSVVPTLLRGQHC